MLGPKRFGELKELLLLDGPHKVLDGGLGVAVTPLVNRSESGGRGLTNLMGKPVGGRELVGGLAARHALGGVYCVGAGQRKDGGPVCGYPQHHHVRDAVGVPERGGLPLAFPNGCDDATAGHGRAHGGAASHGKAAGDGEERSAPGEAGESSEDRERDRPCGGCPGAYLLGRGVHGGSVPAGTDSTGTGWPAGLGS